MNFVPCLAWVAKGLAKSCPDTLQLSAEELKNLIEETKKAKNDNQIDDENASDDGWETASNEDASRNEDSESTDSEKDESNEDNSCSVNEDELDDESIQDEDELDDELIQDEEELDEESAKDDDKDIDAKYDMDDYDKDDDDQPLLNINDVATYVDNKEDAYITDYDAVNEDEEEDNEDFIIKPSDNLLVTGHIEEESSVLEVHIYNKEEDTFYVHHDIVLPAYPLALEWLDYHPSDETPGNYIAVGDMTPVIKIWDLDIVEVLEPDYCLGEKLKTKKKDGEKKKLKCHKDAVISLSWNKHLRNILASGSADSTIIIWNLQEGTALHQLKFHTNKVQSIQWHPFESSFLLSSCTDGLLKVFDCRAPDAECKSWTIDGEIEKVSWNLLDSLKFFCSTESGFVHSFNLKSSEVEHSVKAHSEGVTGLDMCSQLPHVLLTASMDKTLKLWDVKNGFKLINSQKLKVGQIYTAKFAPDAELPVAVGGNYASNSLKIVDLAEVLGLSNKCRESSQNLKTEMKSTTSENPENTRLPKKMKFGKPNTSQNRSFNHNTASVKPDDTQPLKKKKMKFEKPSTSQNRSFNHNTASAKPDDTQPPKKKKRKFEKPSTSQNRNFNQSTTKKEFRKEIIIPEQNVKRTHIKYT